MKKSDQWRQSRESSKRKLAFDVELPSGMTVKCIPFNLTGYLMSKRLPQRLSQAFIHAGRGASRVDVETTISNLEDLNDITDFMRMVIVTSVVEPVVVMDTPVPDKDEIGIDEVPWEDVEFLFRQLTKQAAESTVSMNGKEVTVDSVAAFHAGAPGAASSHDSGDGASVRPEAEPDTPYQ